ncbi:MAG TPA: septation protein A [Thermopetrobacter sp.]|nr:septation protein A [Thermopetrobacter sp.]
MNDASTPRAELQGPLRAAVEYGPLLVFFIANALGGIYAATAAYMIAASIALGVSWLLVRRIPVMPLVALVFVLIFGGLTIWLHDATFIKLKVTLVNALFGAILLGGLMFRRPLLQLVMGRSVDMDDEGWRKLTWRWGLFFFFLAALNELVWRNVSTETWVNFKVFGLIGLTILFAVLQAPLMMRHMKEQPDD